MQYTKSSIDMPSVQITFQNNADCDAKICWESPENSRHAARVFGEVAAIEAYCGEWECNEHNPRFPLIIHGSANVKPLQPGFGTYREEVHVYYGATGVVLDEQRCI